MKHAEHELKILKAKIQYLEEAAVQQDAEYLRIKAVCESGVAREASMLQDQARLCEELLALRQRLEDSRLEASALTQRSGELLRERN